jgi:hypothetical protein
MQLTKFMLAPYLENFLGYFFFFLIISFLKPSLKITKQKKNYKITFFFILLLINLLLRLLLGIRIYYFFSPTLLFTFTLQVSVGVMFRIFIIFYFINGKRDFNLISSKMFLLIVNNELI